MHGFAGKGRPTIDAVERLQRLLKDEIKTRFRINPVKRKRFSELLQASLAHHANRSVEAARSSRR
jgi:type I restriction enzyme R subunit